MTIYMKDGIEIHLPGQLVVNDHFELRQKSEGQFMADFNSSGLIHIKQMCGEEAPSGFYTRASINKSEILFIDYENDGGGEDGEIYRPKLMIDRREVRT